MTSQRNLCKILRIVIVVHVFDHEHKRDCDKDLFVWEEGWVRCGVGVHGSQWVTLDTHIRCPCMSYAIYAPEYSPSRKTFLSFALTLRTRNNASKLTLGFWRCTQSPFVRQFKVSRIRAYGGCHSIQSQAVGFFSALWL